MHEHIYRSDQAPMTKGIVMRRARYYDLMVNVLTFGHAARLRSATVALARITPGEHVLEVGCGTGEVCLAAAGAGGTVFGIDPSPEMIAVARQKVQRTGAAVDVRIGVIERLPFADHTFDVVLSSLMMHHLPGDLKREGLAEIRRVLKPGGRLVIVDARRPTSPWGRLLNLVLLHGALRQGIQDLRPLLIEHGFTDIQEGNILWRMLGFVTAQAS